MRRSIRASAGRASSGCGRIPSPLANAVRAELAPLGLGESQFRARDLAVTSEAIVPAVLVELGFVSNPVQERLLATAGVSAARSASVVRRDRESLRTMNPYAARSLRSAAPAPPQRPPERARRPRILRTRRPRTRRAMRRVRRFGACKPDRPRRPSRPDRTTVCHAFHPTPAAWPSSAIAARVNASTSWRSAAAKRAP